MKRLFFPIFLMIAIVLPASTSAQSPELSGHILINMLEIGATETPNHLYLADVPETDMAEMVVENRPIFAPWIGWSPDGRHFAFLAPARRGINYEVWLGNPSNFDPALHTPFLKLGLTAVAAAWNPRFNIVAVATHSEEGRDGLYLLNGDTDWIVFLREEALSRSPILDWSKDAQWLAYTTADETLKIIQTEDETTFNLYADPAAPPMRLSESVSGWTAGDAYYLFTDQLFQSLYAYQADDSDVYFDFDPAVSADPLTVQLTPSGEKVLVLDGNELLVTNLLSASLQKVQLETQAEIQDYAVANDDLMVLNTFLTKPEGIFAECALLEIGENTPQPMPQILGAPDLTHTRCKVLEGGNYLAIMATNARESYERLPENWLYSLYIVPISLEGGAFITDSYAGFETSQLGFSESRQQVIFLEGDELVVYNLSGARAKLASLQELGVSSGMVDFQFAWQP